MAGHLTNVLADLGEPQFSGKIGQIVSWRQLLEILDPSMESALFCWELSGCSMKKTSLQTVSV